MTLIIRKFTASTARAVSLRRRDVDVELENFRIFKGVAERGGFRHQDQLAAWMQYKGTLPEAFRGLKFARKKNEVSPQYFISLLESVKVKSK